jgi:hypothetical protein
MLIDPPTPVELAVVLAATALVVAAAGWIVRSRRLALPPPAEAALAGRIAPILAGAVSALIVLFVWGSLNEPGNIHDEHAYLLQAEIFAAGRWTGEPPPVSDFFEQTHVFIEPHLVAKYPPGNSLLLVPGVWLGLPGLIPVLLSGVAGALLFAIVRRVSDPSMALLVWALWSTSTVGLYWRASYYSQNVTGVLWLLALAGLLRWTLKFRPADLAGVAFACAWMFLTRPLTAVALGVPVAAVVAVAVWRRRFWAQAAIAVAVVIPVFLLNLLWQERTVGDWRVNPYSEYSRQYMPFDKPGFGIDRTPAVKPLTPAHQWIEQEFVAYHVQHVAGSLPVILASRLIVLLLVLGEHWRGALVLLLGVGALFARGAARFGVISAAALVGAYLIYAHPAWWTVYYLEAFPVFFYVAIAGLAFLARTWLHLDRRELACVLALLFLVMTPWLIRDVLNARSQIDERNEFQRRAREVLSQLPDPSAVVFVNYPSDHLHFRSLILNTPDYRAARLWLVYDRGADNERLLNMTDRAAYRLHAGTWELERLR